MRSRLGPATAVVLAGMLLGIVTGPASAATGGTERPLIGPTGEVTTVLNLCSFPFPGTIEGSGAFAHLGNTTIALDFTISVSGSGEAVQSGSGTLTAANGDVLFVTFSGTITDTSPTHNTSTSVFTITGGTGRFVDASGTFTVEAIGSVVSTSGCTQILRHDTTITGGTLSY